MTEDPRPHPSWPWTPVVALLAGLACWTALACTLRRGHVGDVMDDGLYFVAARALAAGDGNTLPSQVGPPVRSRYPVGLSAIVAAALRVAPGGGSLARDERVARGVIVASGWVFVLASYGWLRRSGVSGVRATLAALATAFHPMVVMSALSVMSELPFAAVAAVLLRRWSVGRKARGAAGHFSDGVLCGLAFAIRGNGVDLIPGAFLAAGRGGPRRRAVVNLLACALGLIVVVLGARWLVGLGNGGRVVSGGYGGEMTAGLGSAGAVLGLVAGHARDVVAGLPLVVAPVLDTNAAKAFPRLATALGVGVLLVFVAGASRLARVHSSRGRDLPAWSYLVLSLLTFIAWPGWFSLRFLVSMFPMAHLAFGVGADGLGRWLGLGARGGNRLGTGAIGLALACNLAFVGQLAWTARGADGLIGDPSRKRDLDAALRHVRDALPADAVVVSMVPELVYLFTSRQGSLLMPEDDRTLLRLGRVDRLDAAMALGPGRPYYLLGLAPDADGPLEARQMEAYARRPDFDVTEVFRSPGGRFVVALVTRRGRERP